MTFLKKQTEFSSQGFQTRHFRKAFSILLTLFLLLIVSLSGLFIKQAKEALEEDSIQTAQSLLRDIGDLVKATKNYAVFIGSLNSVDTIAGNISPPTDDFSKLVWDLNAFSSNAQYHSIELFFEKSRRIYVTQVGMYNYDSYFDADFLKAMQSYKGEEQWLMNRSYKRYYNYEVPVPVVTYMKKIPLYRSGINGFVTINIPLSVIDNIIRQYVATHAVTVTFQGSSFFDNTAAQKSFYTASLTELNTTVSCGFSAADLFYKSQGTLLFMLAMLPVGVLFAVLGGYYYSFLMLAPARKLMKKLKGNVGEWDSGFTDEYERLGEAIDHLTGQVKSFDREMKKYNPLIQEQLLLKLVCNNTELSACQAECTDCGLIFLYTKFVVIILAVADIPEEESALPKEKSKLLVKDTMQQFFGALGKVYGAFGESETIIGVINTDVQNLKERLDRICHALSASLLETLSLPLQISVGICSEDTPLLYRAYSGAKRNLTYTSADQDGFILFSSQNDYIPFADSVILDRIAAAVFDGNGAVLEQLLDYYQKWYLQEDIPLKHARRLSDVCVCSVFSRLSEREMNISETQTATTMKKLSAAISANECGDILKEYFSSLLNAENKVSDRAYMYVNKAILYIHTNYRQNFSVPELAAHVSINGIYLNKIFKLATGKTVSEYLNQYRIQLSLPMLLEGKMTINEISEQIGYPDVRNYIRFFKKFHGLTPSEYRKNPTQNSEG